MSAVSHPYDEAYYVGGGKSNYLDYAGLEPTIDEGFMPVVQRYAAWCAARRERPAYLDVGCAMGFYVRRLGSLGWDAHGVDISEYAVAEGLKRGIENLSVAPAQALPFPDASFDVVMSNDAMCHIKGRGDVLPTGTACCGQLAGRSSPTRW